jgi:hypothetical protein
MEKSTAKPMAIIMPNREGESSKFEWNLPSNLHPIETESKSEPQRLMGNKLNLNNRKPNKPKETANAH